MTNDSKYLQRAAGRELFSRYGSWYYHVKMGVPHSLTQTNISNGQIPAGKFQPHCLHARPIILTFPIGCDLHYRSDLSRLVNAAQCSRIIGSGISILSATPTPHCPERIPPQLPFTAAAADHSQHTEPGADSSLHSVSLGDHRGPHPSRTTPAHVTSQQVCQIGRLPRRWTTGQQTGMEAANRRDEEGSCSYKIL